MITARGICSAGDGVSRLAGISMDVAPGECLALTGSPGGDRRTLMRILATLEAPASGSLVVCGADAVMQRDDVRQRLAYASAESLEGERLTVREYFELVAERRPGARAIAWTRLSPGAARWDGSGPEADRVAHLLQVAQVAADARIDRLPPESRAIVAAAAAFTSGAGVLLLDLPHGALEDVVSRALMACVGEARARGAAVVLATADGLARPQESGLRDQGCIRAEAIGIRTVLADAHARPQESGLRDQGCVRAEAIGIRAVLADGAVSGAGKDTGCNFPDQTLGKLHPVSFPGIRRELVVTARSGAFWAAAFVHVVVLAAFVLVWGDGLPVQGGGTAFEQFAALESLMLAVLLPWVAVRCGVPAHRDALLLQGIASGRTPRQVVATKCAALSLVLAGVLATALPLWMVMRQVAALSVGEMLLSVLPFLALAPVAAVLSVAAAVGLRNRMLGWVVAAVVLVVVW